MGESFKDSNSFDLGRDNYFASFFKGLPEKPSSSSLRFFEKDNGKYYAFFGDDALHVANTVYKTTTALKYMGDLPYCTLSPVNALSHMRYLLTEKGYRVEVWSLEGSKKWRLSKSGSPGNLQDLEDLLFDSDKSLNSAPVVVALRVVTKDNQRIVGAALADASTRRLALSEFLDNELFCNLESYLLQTSAKEVLLAPPTASPSDQTDFNKLRSVADRCGVVITERKRSEFKEDDVESDLQRLVDENMSGRTELTLTASLGPLAALLKYLDLLRDESNFGQYTLARHDLDQYVRLDSAAVRSLDLGGMGAESTKSASLFSLLNHCKTAQGTRLLNQWIRQPLVAADTIDERQNLVSVLVDNPPVLQALQDHLKKVPDLVRLGKKFQRGKATLQDVVRIYQCVTQNSALVELLESYEGTHGGLVEKVWIDPVKKNDEDLEKFKELVDTTVDLDLKGHEFFVKADYDEGLGELKQRMEEAESGMVPEAKRVARELGLEYDKKLKFENKEPHGHYLRITTKDSSAVRNKKEYIELATQKAGVLFTTAKLRDLDRRYADAEAEYREKQRDIEKQIVEVAAGYFPILESLNDIMAQMDVIAAFAHASTHAPIPYVRPKIHPRGSEDSKIILKGLRHPLLEAQTDISFIPNDVELAKNGKSFHIITGPNMGGKSTYIRSVAIAVLMALMGCYVPATDDDGQPEVSIVDAVYCRVGSGDSQLRGISTFMMEMVETAAILRSATPDSLIVIDELGRGTSTYDGFGLAWAISEHIATNIRCHCLFATHFHELTVLADKVASVKNSHVTAYLGDGTITLLYKVHDGACDQSFGIHVAELAQFPQRVVQVAKRKAAELEEFTGKDDEEPPRPWKSSRSEIDDGTTIIRNFLADFASVPDLDKMPEQELLETVQGLKEKYKVEIDGNPFCNEVLAAYPG
ncbi:DNA mismatch repair protein [Gonapodya prolifera JEL478]|uniref:DNA mismatch repair protein MSH2 n=1 Tax=Gonapodya prolifera (strain JEL478) TaxID=1344416 RepID=A0A139AW63_GONPJ|nr:DNA mismatch repair protein [Gonapodya prolifera JEL478]|eukprot:KXS20715.1 DNA mismatch repair protein [Gonapodya prolifera JEL478]